MTETLSRLEELQSIHWDMHKDAYGFRPRGMDTSGWSEAQFNSEFELLQQVIARENAERLVLEAEAAEALEVRIQNLIHPGTNRAQVIAWIADAEGANGDMEFLCFLLGLRYGYFR